MEKNLKSFSGVLLTASTLFLITTVSLFFMRQAEIEKRVSVEKRLDDLTKEKVKLANALEETIVIKNDLEVKLGGLEERAKSLEGQLDEEKRSRETVYSQLENEKRESRRIADDLIKVQGEKDQISQTLTGIRNECESLKAQLSSVQQAKEVLESKLKDILSKKEVELEKIVVRPEAPVNQDAGAPIKGEILVINKKFDFAVVSLGDDAGIRPGMNLNVYRNGRFLTALQVEKVHASMSAAKIPPEAKNIDIREGDEVVVQ
ncbi:MAG: hypothetical protein PHO42_05300 [Candidatus Omnitrophica bacterium]|nr:hypothetical protein [Candidatus Omnitrophota bacterium]